MKYTHTIITAAVGGLVALMLTGCLESGGGSSGGGAANDAPVASAGANQSVIVGATVSLSGSASTDANNDPLAYIWTLTTKPAGSTATLTGATTPTPTFITDKLGIYVAMLVVSDGMINSAPVTVTVSAGPGLNDTGVTADLCFQAGSSVLVACSSVEALALNGAQDGMIGRDANAVSNSDADGKSGFSFSAVGGGCVLDNVTGLMWEVKTADGGLRDSGWTYTNYDSITALQKSDGAGGYLAPTQAEVDAASNTVGYITAVNATNLCGFSDWRLPTLDELQSIVDYGSASAPAIDANWFPNTSNGMTWAATPYAGYAHGGWVLVYQDGSIFNGAFRWSNYSVRLVRTAQ